MYTQPKTYISPLLFNTFSDQLNPSHPLYLLSNKLNWQLFEESFAPLYCSNNGRPCKPVRL
ncbi:MAG: IS5/IS1182 family transposase, partial [Rikenellaceae bacterium]